MCGKVGTVVTNHYLPHKSVDHGYVKFVASSLHALSVQFNEEELPHTIRQQAKNGLMEELPIAHFELVWSTPRIPSKPVTVNEAEAALQADVEAVVAMEVQRPVSGFADYTLINDRIPVLTPLKNFVREPSPEAAQKLDRARERLGRLREALDWITTEAANSDELSISIDANGVVRVSYTSVLIKLQDDQSK